MNPHDEQKLERLVHQTLRDLPPRRAPRSLEQRVLAAIEQRAALPWWRKGFAYWPAAPRFAFLAVVAAVVTGLFRLLTGVDTGAGLTGLLPSLAWAESISSLARTSQDFARVVLGGIPSLWLYGGLAVMASLYAALFGLGATAYRLLYANR
jgi:hypothetical protein